MSRQIIENETGQEEAVSIGNGQLVSMQVVQDVYNEMTGKTEKLSKSIKSNHKTKFEDVEQLNTKVHQLYEQYNILENNCNITLYHIDDCNEVFSSFERFRLYDKSSLSAVENIRLQYNFLILLPKSNRPQTYTLEINIHSRSAIRKKSEKEHGLSKRIMNIVSSRTAVIEIEYIDYTVARNFMVTIQHWFEALDSTERNKVVEIIQDHTHSIVFSFKYISALFILTYFYLNHESWLQSAMSIELIFKLSILCFGSVFILSGIAARLGITLARSIENIHPMSYLKLNRGDDKAILCLQKSNKKSIAKVLLSVLFTIGINVFSAWLVLKIGINM